MGYFLLMLIGIGIFYWRRSRRTPKRSLYAAECYLKTEEPVPLCGAPDVIWLEDGKRLAVEDYKSRKRRKVYDSDVIQLSVYRLILLNTQSKPVSDYGYISFHNGSRKKVRLLSEGEVVRLVKRYQGILAGQKTPKACRQPAYCRYCPHQKHCKS